MRQAKIIRLMLQELDEEVDSPPRGGIAGAADREWIHDQEEKIKILLKLFDCKTVKKLRALVLTSEEGVMEAITGCRTPAELKKKVLSGKISLSKRGPRS